MANFWQDNTTDTAGTLLTAHAPQAGTSYVIPAGKACTATIDASNRILNGAANVESIAQLSATPPLSVDFNCTFTFGASPQYFDVIFRQGSDGSTTYKGWLVGYSAGDVAGGGWSINNYVVSKANIAFAAANSTHQFRATILRMPNGDDVITVYQDGLQVCQWTDPGGATFPTAGKCALYMYSQGAEMSAITATALLGIGSLTATPSPGAITLSLSTGLFQGTGASYSYNIYRSTTANFTPGSGNLLATVTNLGSTPYVDATAVPGTMYFYIVKGTDSGGNIVYAIPNGLTNYTPLTAIPATAKIQLQNFAAINLVGFGDSKVRSADGGGSPQTWNPVSQCAIALASLGRTVFSSNQGVDGSASSDWLLSSANLNAAIAAMTSLVATTPSAAQIFFGGEWTNDCAQSGKSGSPISVAQNLINMKAITAALIAAFPNCYVFWDYPSWFSPNAVTSYVYGPAGLDLMLSYAPNIPATVAVGPTRQVFAGDNSFGAMAAQDTSLMRSATGSNGNYELHYSPTGGTLKGQLWANVIESAFGLTGGSGPRIVVGS
ncbi:MAG: hypothetical protein M3O30_17385 [Planctomycetota bacterium]|nr:hypothetical protein [Planctomycetota bacterium]